MNNYPPGFDESVLNEDITKTEYIVFIEDKEMPYPDVDKDAAEDCYRIQCIKAEGSRDAVSLIERTHTCDDEDWSDYTDNTLKSNF